MSYISLSDVKAYINITSTDDDTLLTALIASAQKMIDAHTARTFEAAGDTTRYLSIRETLEAGDAEGRRTVIVPWDLCTITTVTNGDAVVVAGADYFTRPRNSTPYYAIVLRLNSDVAWTYEDDPDDAIAVLGRWAYSTSAPEDVQLACKRLTAYLYKQRDNLDELDRPIASGDGMMLLPGRLPKDVKDILAPYRKRVP